MTVTVEQASSKLEAAKEALSDTKARLAKAREVREAAIKSADAEIEALCTAIGRQQMEVARLNHLYDQARLALVREGSVDA